MQLLPNPNWIRFARPVQFSPVFFLRFLLGNMDANPTPRDRKNQFTWPVAGLATGVIAAINPFYKPHISPSVGITAWFVDVVLVLFLSGHPIGARIGVLLAGLSLAVPCFLWAEPLPRALLMCFMALPFAAAAAFVLAPPIASLRVRLAHLCSWCGSSQVKERERNFDAAAFLQFIVAAVVLAVAMTVVKAASAHGLLPVRWLAGGIMVLAFAEVVTACHEFLTALMGLTVRPLFQSPYLSASVGEFWTRRWNIAASKLFRKYCFAPLARRGVWLALFAAFVVSAVAHVLLAYMAFGRWGISLINGAFFLVQPFLIAAERWVNVQRWRPAAGRAWTLAVLTIASPLFIEPVLQLVEGSWDTSDDVLLPAVAALGLAIVFSSIAPLAALVSRPTAVAGR